MIVNKNTRIIGEKVILVPYRKDHVLKYHNWMQNAELREITGSEPLTLEEEYDMQKSWLIDSDKLTFIILNKETYERTKSETESMIGDTNLFFVNPHDHGAAEAEIMIAEPSARGQKCGWEAMLMMFTYSIAMLSTRMFDAKVKQSNEVSIRMFTQMGFTVSGVSKVFQEVTMTRIVDDTWTDWLAMAVQEYQVVEDCESAS